MSRPTPSAFDRASSKCARPLRAGVLGFVSCAAAIACSEAAIVAVHEGSGGTASGGGAMSGGGAASGGATGGEPGTGGVGGGDEWVLVWQEEFDGEGAPSSENWSFETRAPGWVNDELQNYTGARAENVRLENGSLVIEARRDEFEGHEYSSARIHTAGKAEFTYGRFEVRAKLPSGVGTWPAIWMMPGDAFKYATTCTNETGWDEDCDAWPNSGEIDIMEHVGHDPGVVHATIHCNAYNWQRPEQRSSAVPVEDVFGAFHVYSLVRTADAIEAFVDGEKYFTFENENAGWESWPFDEPFYFILNVAVGGTWGGQEGVDPAVFPQRMEVDYVRVFERAN